MGLSFGLGPAADKARGVAVRMNAATKYVVTCRPGSLRLHRRCSNQAVLSLMVDGFDSLQHFPSFFHLFPGPSYFGSSFAGTILFYTEVL